MFLRLYFPQGHFVPKAVGLDYDKITKYAKNLFRNNSNSIQVLTPGDYFLMSPNHKDAQHFLTYVALRVISNNQATIRQVPKDKFVMLSQNSGQTFEHFTNASVFHMPQQATLFVASSVNSNLVDRKKYVAKLYYIIAFVPR